MNSSTDVVNAILHNSNNINNSDDDDDDGILQFDKICYKQGNLPTVSMSMTQMSDSLDDRSKDGSDSHDDDDLVID